MKSSHMGGMPELGPFGLDRIEGSIARWESESKTAAATSSAVSQGEAGDRLEVRLQSPPPLDPGAPRRMVHIDSQGRPSVLSVSTSSVWCGGQKNPNYGFTGCAS